MEIVIKKQVHTYHKVKKISKENLTAISKKNKNINLKKKYPVIPLVLIETKAAENRQKTMVSKFSHQLSNFTCRFVHFCS